MAFCARPWAADMPARTKAQRAARLERAKEEEALMGQRLDLYRDMSNKAFVDYQAAMTRRCLLERARA